MDGKTTSAAAAVQDVSEWALLSTRHFVIYFVLRCPVRYGPGNCSQSAYILPCGNRTDAEAVEEAAFLIRMLCYALSQVAAAELALLLPSRLRLALAYLALAFSILGNCMYASSVYLLLAADPGYLLAWIVCPAAVFFHAVGDILNLLIHPLRLLLLLLLQGGDE